MIYLIIGFIGVLLTLHLFQGEPKRPDTKRERIIAYYSKRYPSLTREEIIETIGKKGFEEHSEPSEIEEEIEDSWFYKKKKAIMKYKNLKPSKGSKNDPFYVYFYMIDGVVKYVGKGKTVLETSEHNEHKFVTYHRAADIYNHKHCKPFVDEITIKIVETFNCEQKALTKESELIAHYGLNNLLNQKA